MNEDLRLLNYLEQDIAEDSVNKRLIHDKVWVDICSLTQVGEAIELVNEYRSKDWWESKSTGLLELSMSSKDIVKEILIRVCQLTKDTMIQAICSIDLGYEDVFDNVQTAAELVGVIAECGLYDVFMDKTMKVRNHVELDPDVRSFIDGCHYLPPMVSKPQKITKNTQGGYLNFNESVLLGKTKHHEGELCLSVLNIQNSIELTLDKTILGFEEEPTGKEDKALFNKMKRDSRSIYSNLDIFWLTHKYDGRGRLYSRGYNVTYQSSQYKRALITLAKQETIYD